MHDALSPKNKKDAIRFTIPNEKGSDSIMPPPQKPVSLEQLKNQANQALPQLYIQVISRHIEENNFAYHWKIISDKGITFMESYSTFPTREAALDHFNEQKRIFNAIAEYDIKEYPKPETKQSFTTPEEEIRVLQSYKDEMIKRILELEEQIKLLKTYNADMINRIRYLEKKNDNA